MLTVTTKDLQDGFDRYLRAVQQGETVVILQDGREVARLISVDHAPLTDALTGVLKHDYDDKSSRRR